MASLPSRVDFVVIGAGQAGLTVSRHLSRAGRDHIVLERRSTPGGGWQDRWDGFQLVTPNWMTSLPGMPYDGDEPDGFMPRDEIAGRIARYAATIHAPVILEAGVERLRAGLGGGFVLDTTQGRLEARSVVVAIGGFHRPGIPAIARALPNSVLSVHSHDYRREADLPPGAVMVVGSAQTGTQLVEELRDSGREVYLCLGSAGRVPRRYRGSDIFHWLRELAEHGPEVGVTLPTADQLPDPRQRLAGNPHVSGHGGGHDIDLRRMGEAGTTLLGRLEAIDGDRIRLAPDVREKLSFADGFFAQRFQDIIDAFITAAGIDCPPADPLAVSAFEPPIVEELDLAKEGISTILWTTGYRQDLGWIGLPITDELGFARQTDGVSEVAGLFFIGSLWQHDQVSANLIGLQRDARVLAARMGLGEGPGGSGS
jgi:putative flavoprotein involved in K+ transport